MSVLFLLVAYNNSTEVEAFVRRLRAHEEDTMDVDFAICDNSAKNTEWSTDIENCVLVRRPDNPGYLEGALLALDEYKQRNRSIPDWVFVSNTDLELVSCLSEPLRSEAPPPDSLCVVAPRITEGPKMLEMNPHEIKRRPRWRLAIDTALTRNDALAVAYLTAHDIREQTRFRRESTATMSSRDGWKVMYSPYGAIFGLSRGFIDQGQLPRHVPLFMEEYAIAEAARRHAAPVVYIPSLHFHHTAHETTGLLPSRKRARLISNAFKNIWEDRRYGHE